MFGAKCFKDSSPFLEPWREKHHSAPVPIAIFRAGATFEAKPRTLRRGSDAFPRQRLWVAELAQIRCDTPPVSSYCRPGLNPKEIGHSI